MRKASRSPDAFDVRFLLLDDYPALTRYQGQPYRHSQGKQRLWDNKDLQSFTPLRFLPPQEMNYAGTAVVLDPDVFALGDIFELLERDMHGAAVMCCPHDAKNRRRAGYNSSVMLLDCCKLLHWRWEHQLEQMFAGEFTWRQWAQLELEDAGTVGILEAVWNHRDKLNTETKLLHNTRRLTQPWKTGLPIDFTPKNWHNHPKVYQPHPDRRQEDFFLSLLRESIDEGFLDIEFVKVEMEQGHLRRDALKLVGVS
ncbi:hypothetical protein N9H39_01935 [Gammaproteobacteria bacterium]|nr:hypothetical protein [Gammaproteobacteria bacterium]